MQTKAPGLFTPTSVHSPPSVGLTSTCSNAPGRFDAVFFKLQGLSLRSQWAIAKNKPRLSNMNLVEVEPVIFQAELIENREKYQGSIWSLEKGRDGRRLSYT